MAKYSEKQNKWTQDYIKRSYESVCVRFKKGERQKYIDHAKKRGKSLNQLIIDLLDTDMLK